MKLSHTGDDYEPEFLPARYPHALFNPQLSGIGYAYASNIPSFNVTEVLEATIKLIKDPDAEILLIPDSPTGADIVDDGQFQQICDTGVGTITMRGSVEIDEINNIITITSIPLQTTVDAIIRNIVELREKKVFTEIKDIKDYTKNETGVKTMIYLEHTANPYKTVEKLYKKNTGLKKTYAVGIRLIDDYRDAEYGVTSFLKEWIEYRRDIVRSSFNTKLVKAMEQQNINDILLFILNKDNAEETIKMAKKSVNKSDFAEKLMKKYKMDSQQANTIANMRIYAFSKESYQGYKEKKEELLKEIDRIEGILDDDGKIDDVIIEQLEEGIKLFGSKRKSKIVKDDALEDDIPDTEHIVALSSDGFIKKVPINLKQIGQVGSENGRYMTIHISNRQSILVFDSTGKLSEIPISKIPDMKLKNKGISLERYFSVHGKIVSVLIKPDEEFFKKEKDMYIIFLTKLGFVKKTLLSEFNNINGSVSVIKLPSTDELVSTEFTKGDTNKEVVIYTNKGNGIRKNIRDFSTMKANARGIRQLTLEEDEYCIGFDKIVSDKKYLLYVTSAGRMKITESKYFPSSKKKDDVLSLIKLEKNETLIGMSSVTGKERICIYKKNSQPEVFELTNLSVSTRVAKPEKVVKTPKGDAVLSYAVIV